MNPQVRVTPAQMLLLGVGWFGAQVFWAFHGATLPLFLASRTDSKFEASLVLGLAGVSGVVVPPLVGYLSDRTRSRFGRRAPWVAAGMFGASLCILGLPRTESLGGAAALAGLMYFCLRTAETPFLSLLPDVTPREQRSTASGVMNLLGSVGLISCFAAGSLIWESNPSAMFTLVAIVSFGAMLASAARVRSPAMPPATGSPAHGIREHLRGLTGERNAMRFLAAQFFWWTGFWMISTFLVLFGVEELGVAQGRSFLMPLVFSVVATVAMLPLGMLGDRFGRKTILSPMIVLWAGLAVALGLTRNLPEALVAVGLTAIPFAAVMAIGYALFLDLIPEERTAEFVGIGVLTVASAQFVGPLIAGQLIDGFGYRAVFPVAAVFQLVGVALLQSVQPPSAA